MLNSLQPFPVILSQTVKVIPYTHWFAFSLCSEKFFFRQHLRINSLMSTIFHA